MSAIMEFLKPGGRYQYIKTASFARLLRDPQSTVLEGDCNQIVTLYAYLYSRQHPITDLQIKILPEHVCLHLQGVDIEATNGTFQRYAEHTVIAPITELLAVNLLDISDFREMTAEISEKSILESAKLAYVLSSNRALVERNLVIAYHNLAIAMVNQKNFQSALFYAKRANNKQVLEYVHNTAAQSYVQQKNFSKAQYHANQLGNKSMQQYVDISEGMNHLVNKRYDKARFKFQKYGDSSRIKIAYQQEYNDLVKTTQSYKTLEQMKKHKSTYRKILQLSNKAGLGEQERQIRNMLNQI